jgi:hypothetical protein
MAELATLTGTPKQIEWAGRLRAERVAWGWRLPDIPDARFWIDNRDCTSGDLEEAARRFVAERDSKLESPFTETFPRFGREEARLAMEGLRHLSGSVGVIVLDLETTGLEKTDRVVEIAAVRWPSREPLINRVVYVPTELAPAEITGITTAEINAAPPFEAFAQGVADWAEGAHLVAWNSRFDMRFLRRELARSMSAPALRATCAMRLAQAWLGLDDWPTLEEVLPRFGIERSGGAHRAMPDVLTTCAVLDAMGGGASNG